MKAILFCFQIFVCFFIRQYFGGSQYSFMFMHAHHTYKQWIKIFLKRSKKNLSCVKLWVDNLMGYKRIGASWDAPKHFSFYNTKREYITKYRNILVEIVRQYIYNYEHISKFENGWIN